MQPLLVSKISSSAPITSWWSTPTSPNSFSITAIFLPWFSDRMRFSSVVLPAPRKPVNTVTGMRTFDVMQVPSGAAQAQDQRARRGKRQQREQHAPEHALSRRDAARRQHVPEQG